MARILVVDDDDDIRRVARVTLESVGYRVIEAIGGDEALDLDTTGTDVVVLDLSMPEVDGFSVLRHYQLRGSKRPRVLVLTARPAERDRQRALAEGAVGYVAKPFDPDDLLAEVQRVAFSAEEALEERRVHEIYMSRMISLLDDAARQRNTPRLRAIA